MSKCKYKLTAVYSCITFNRNRVFCLGPLCRHDETTIHTHTHTHAQIHVHTGAVLPARHMASHHNRGFLMKDSVMRSISRGENIERGYLRSISRVTVRSRDRTARKRSIRQVYHTDRHGRTCVCASVYVCRYVHILNGQV